MYWEALIRLIIAMILGGLVGLEREIGNRPAGFRTHTLVCVGSALVMLTAQYIFDIYKGAANPDPARLGAQVISGIGFLGAGTILKDGSNVRGLTTAASLWVVACVGLAIGVGFYWGGIFTAVIAYVILILLKKVERLFVNDIGKVELDMDIRNMPGQIARVTGLLDQLNVQIKDIKLSGGEDPWTQLRLIVVLPVNMTRKAILSEISRLEGVVVDMDI